MSDNKKYYYLKLKENFFDREEIKVIKGMEKGDSYVCIMLEMYLRSLKRDGLLMMTDRIPYNLQTLSSVLGRPQDEIKYAIELFTEFRLIDVLATGEMYMSDIQNFIGQSSTEGDRKRKYRKQIEEQKSGQMSGQKSLPPSKKPKKGKNAKSVGQMSDKRPPEIEIEIEIEKEIEIDINISSDLSLILNDFYDMRKKIKSPMTDRAKTLLKNKLEELAPNDEEKKIKILEQSIVNSWKSVFPLKKNYEQQSFIDEATNTVKINGEGYKIG